MSTEWGDLERRLNELGSDIGGAPLPGPGAARRRGRQRTRRQVAGATLGIAAAAFGVISLGGLGPLSTSPPEPAHTPTPTPAPAPTEAPGNELALTVDLLEANSGANELVGWVRLENRPDELFACAPEANDADHVIESWFQSSPDGYLHQIIEIGTAETAKARFEAVIDEVLSCIEERNADNPDDNRLSNIWTVDGIGDGAWLAEYFVPPRGPDGELMIVQVSVALAGDSVTIVNSGGPGMHGTEAGPLPYDNLAAAADQLCKWAGRDCISEPDPQRAYPPVNTEVEPGWLTIEDIVAATPYFASINTVDAVEDAYGMHVCFEAAGDPFAAGAGSFENRSYSDNRDMALEVNITQLVLRFQSGDAAQSYYTQLVNSVEACGGQQTGDIGGDGYEGVTWLANDEFVSLHLGAVVYDSAVSILVAGQPSASQNELPAEQMQALLDQAGVRLGELE